MSSYRLGRARAQVMDRLLAAFYAGRAVECPLCGWRGRAFPRRRCPSCGSLARHRLMPYAVRVFGLEVERRVVLHIGANREESDWLGRMEPRLHLRFDLLRQPVTNLVGDVQRPPLAAGSVDLIVAWHVLEHVPDDRAAMLEMHRVLRPGGSVLCSVPIFPVERRETYEDPTVPRERFEEVYGHPDHVRACGADYGDRFRDAGFTVRTLAVREAPAADVERHDLSRGHVAWLCTKDPSPGATARSDSPAR